MKKSRIVGYALTLAATLFVGSAMGQFNVNSLTYTNFVELKAGSDSTSLVLKGAAHGFYVKPDLAFHSSYETDGKLTTGFQWKWSVIDGTTTDITPATFPVTNTVAVATPNANYQAFSFNKVGRYTLAVQEIASSAWGGCNGANKQFRVYAYNIDSIENKTASATTAICVSSASLQSVHFLLKSSGTPYIKYKITQELGTVSGATGLATWGTASDFLASQTLATAAGALAWNATASSIPANLVANGTALTLTNALDTVSTTMKLAKYDFEITRSLAAPTKTNPIIRYTFEVESIVGLITRKSQHTQTNGDAPAAGYTYNKNVPSGKFNTVSLILAIAPSTGPVYHIGNNKAN